MSLLIWAAAALKSPGRSAVPPEPTGDNYVAMRTLDRAFSGHPAWGGGNVGAAAFDYEHDGARFRVWQIIPFDGPAIQGVLGACRIHIRNRDVNRGQNTLEMMPDRITLSDADWTGLPWTFTRTTNPAQFVNVASGNAARKAVTYIADRTITVGTTAGSLGIDAPASGQPGDTFTATFHYD